MLAVQPIALEVRPNEARPNGVSQPGLAAMDGLKRSNVHTVLPVPDRLHCTPVREREGSHVGIAPSPTSTRGRQTTPDARQEIRGDRSPIESIALPLRSAGASCSRLRQLVHHPASNHGLLDGRAADGFRIAMQ